MIIVVLMTSHRYWVSSAQAMHNDVILILTFSTSPFPNVFSRSNKEGVSTVPKP